MKKGMFILFILLLILIPIVNSATVINECSNLNTANTIYELSNTVNSTGTCMNITSDDITLDCKGFNLNYSSSSYGYGINATGIHNFYKKL